MSAIKNYSLLCRCTLLTALLIVKMAASPMAKIALENNNFAIDLYKTLSPDSENVFFSPFSIVSALAMTTLGAQNNTLTQMLSSMHLADHKNQTEIHENLGKLTQKLQTKAGGEYVLSLANKLFTRTGSTLKPEFLIKTRNHYNAETSSLDFGADPEGSRKTINSWVEDQTQQKIKDLLAEGTIDSMTALVIANAIYFKGDWDEQFDRESTRKGDFHVSQDEEIKVDLMFRNDKFNIGYSEELGAKSIELPYKGKELSMLLVLPLHPLRLAEVESKMNAKNLEELLSCPDNEKVDLTLPKFKVEHAVSLNDKLKALGMTDLFTQGVADLSGIDGTNNLYVSEVAHKAFIDVNEEGSEAAAATGMGIMMMCMPPQFDATEPFLYFIRDNSSGTILFMGRITRPNYE